MTLTARRPGVDGGNRQRLMQEVAGGTGRKRRLNAEVEESLHRRIKVRAAEEGRTVSDITRSLWTEYLNRAGTR